MASPDVVMVVRGTSGSDRRLREELEEQLDDSEIIEARDGREGLERLEGEASIDCIVSRYELEGIDGLEFLRAVRDRYSKLPFVLITDEGSEAVASDAISAGVTEYLNEERFSDPYAELATRIESHVSEFQSTRGNEQWLTKLTGNSTDCLWMFTRDWDELLFISGYEEVWGRSKAELEANPRDFLNAVHPDDKTSVKEAMGRLSEGESIDIEYRLLNDGETEWVWVKGEPIFDEFGTVDRIVGFTRDITERRQRERRYQTLVENLPGIVYRTEVAPDWPMRFIQGECEVLTGYTADELTDEVDFGPDLIHPDDQDAVFEMIEGAVDRGEPFELTYRILTKDGDTRWVWERGREIEDGIIEGFLTDITARVTHKQDLELRNQAINEAPIGVVMTDPHQEDNPLVYVNRKFLEMTGYSRDDVLGRNCRLLQGPDTRTEPIAELREAIDAREPVTVEMRNYRVDGVMFWNRVSIAPVHDDDGELVNFIGFQEDVTERKQRQEQLKVLSRVLRHNLRNNQNAIRSWAEVLREEADPELVEYTQRIIDSSYQLMTIAEKERMITEILTEKPRRQCVKLDLVLSQTNAEIRGEFPEAICTIDCPEETTIQATVRIEQAIEELLRNAILHNDSSTPEVSVTVAETPDTVEVSVADNGPPIPEMEYPEMLSEKEESPVYHHGGLGLWLVNLVVSRSGATMEIEENEPRGNLVRITFPK